MKTSELRSAQRLSDQLNLLDSAIAELTEDISDNPDFELSFSGSVRCHNAIPASIMEDDSRDFPLGDFLNLDETKKSLLKYLQAGRSETAKHMKEIGLEINEGDAD